MSYSGAIGRLITFAIGGGWGSEDEKDNYSKVAVIRGTDIPRVTNGDFSTVPFRYEDDKKIANRKLNVGDIVLETAGGSSANGQFTGRTLLVTEEVLEKLGTTICASFCKRLEVDKNLVNPGYFYHYMQDLYKSGRVASYDSQSTGISNFQFDVFKTTEHLDLGSMKHQEQVSSLLSGIQNQINLNSQISKTLEDIAQTIFKSWFIDFDPVKAKMAGEKPVGMDDATAALFPDSMEDSGLGLIPCGWIPSKLEDFAEVKYGAPFASKFFNTSSEGLPLIRIRDLKTQVIATWTSEASPKGFLVKPGQLLVGMDGEFSPVLWFGEDSLVNQRVCLVQNKKDISPWFLYFKLLPILRRIENGAAGSTVIHIGKGDIDAITFSNPGGPVLKTFSDLLSPMLGEIAALNAESRSLIMIRDSLLPRLISGELQIPEEMLVT